MRVDAMKDLYNAVEDHHAAQIARIVKTQQPALCKVNA